MIAKEELQEIIMAGIRAPSGDNTQPWSFTVLDNTVNLFHIPEENTSAKSTVPYFYDSACVAHGALIENMVIAAAHRDYHAEVKPFPSEKDPNFIATLIFNKSEGSLEKEASLYPYIGERRSNRTRYLETPLSQTEKNILLQVVDKNNDIEMRLIEDRKMLIKISSNLVQSLIIMLKQKTLHKFFFAHIVWNKKEENTARAIFAPALALTTFQSLGMRLIKFYPILLVLYYMGTLRFAMRSEFLRFVKSGAIAVLTAKGSTSLEHLNMGRVVERMWLTATQENIAFHPCTATLYLYYNLERNRSIFSAKDQKNIENLYQELKDIFGINDSEALFMMRLGHATSPGIVSSRVVPIIK